MQRVTLFMIGAQYGVNYPLEKTSSCAVGVEDADGGDGHREGAVGVELGDISMIGKSFGLH